VSTPRRYWLRGKSGASNVGARSAGKNGPQSPAAPQVTEKSGRTRNSSRLARTPGELSVHPVRASDVVERSAPGRRWDDWPSLGQSRLRRGSPTWRRVAMHSRGTAVALTRFGPGLW